MSMFRNLLKNNSSSSSYIRLLPESLNYSADEESQRITVESNDKWTLNFKEKE